MLSECVSQPDGRHALLFPHVRKLLSLLIPQHCSACGRHYILVSIPLIAAVQYEMEQEQSRADVSFCSSGAIHHRRRREHRAVARSDLDGDQGRGDYCLPASNNTLANWAQGCSLTPLRAGNVRSAKDLKRPALRWLFQKHEPLA